MPPPERPRWLDDEEQAAWRCWVDGVALLSEAFERDLAGHGLSVSEYEILVRLSEAPAERLRMSALATAVSHSRSRLTHTVSRLERRGLVARQACLGDGRGVECRLTVDGRQLLHQAAPDHVESVRRHFVDVVGRDTLLALGEAMRAVAERGRDEGEPRHSP